MPHGGSGVQHASSWCPHSRAQEMQISGLPPLPPSQRDLGLSLGAHSPAGGSSNALGAVLSTPHGNSLPATTTSDDPLSPASDAAPSSSLNDAYKVGSPSVAGVAEESMLLHSPPPSVVPESSSGNDGHGADERGSGRAAATAMQAQPSVGASRQPRGASQGNPAAGPRTTGGGAGGGAGAAQGSVMQQLGQAAHLQQAALGAAGGSVSRAGAAPATVGAAAPGGVGGAAARIGGAGVVVGGRALVPAAGAAGPGSRSVARRTSPLQPALVPLTAEAPTAGGGRAAAASRGGGGAVSRPEHKDADDCKAPEPSDSKSADAESKTADAGHGPPAGGALARVAVRGALHQPPDSPHGAIRGGGDADHAADADAETGPGHAYTGGGGVRPLRDSTSRAHVLGLQQGTVHASALSSLMAQAEIDEEAKARGVVPGGNKAVGTSVATPASASAAAANGGKGGGGSLAAATAAAAGPSGSAPQHGRGNGRVSVERSSAPGSAAAGQPLQQKASVGAQRVAPIASVSGSAITAAASSVAVGGGGRSSGVGGRAVPAVGSLAPGGLKVPGAGGALGGGDDASDDPRGRPRGDLGGAAGPRRGGAAGAVPAGVAPASVAGGGREPSPPAVTPRGSEAPPARGGGGAAAAADSAADSPALGGVRSLRSRQGFASVGAVGAADAGVERDRDQRFGGGPGREASVERSRSSLHAGAAAAAAAVVDDSTLPIPRSVTGQVYVQARLQEAAAAAAAGDGGAAAAGSGGGPAAGDGWDPYEHYASTRPSSSGGYARPVSQGAVLGGAATGPGGAGSGGPVAGGAAWWKQRGALAPAALVTGGSGSGAAGAAGGGPTSGGSGGGGPYSLSPRNVLGGGGGQQSSFPGGTLDSAAGGPGRGGALDVGSFGGSLRAPVPSAMLAMGADSAGGEQQPPQQRLGHLFPVGGASGASVSAGVGPGSGVKQIGGVGAPQSGLGRLAVGQGGNDRGGSSAGGTLLGAPPGGGRLLGGLAVTSGLGAGTVMRKR